MIRISIDNEDAGLLETLASNLLQAGYTPTSLSGGSSMNALPAGHDADILVLGAPRDSAHIAVVKSVPLPKVVNGQTPWRLNSLQLELTAPDGQQIYLSHDECCILQAAARANGQLLGRKTLIEALGQNFLHYDERRLEALISRLRRRLGSYDPDGFPIRAVRGHGYLFGVKLQGAAGGD